MEGTVVSVLRLVLLQDAFSDFSAGEKCIGLEVQRGRDRC